MRSRCASIAGVPGSDTVRGVGWQQAQAVLAALDVLDLNLRALRVEGVDDVIDIESFTNEMAVHHAKQVKTRAEPYTWGQAALVAILRRWVALPDAVNATFEFLTNGRLGNSGEMVQAALEDAAQGRCQSLADLLGVAPGGTECTILAKARVRVDPAGTGALLLRAESQVAAMLPQARTTADAQERARSAVDALFRVLLDHAGRSDPDARIVTREEIAAVLGVSPDQTASQRWPGGVRDRYLQAARALSIDSVIPSLLEPHGRARPEIHRIGASASEQLDCSDLLLGDGPVMLTGRTGTGKSTAADSLRHDAAEADRVVLLAHAETYLPGRLEALTADALSGPLAEDLPFATGRQALADRDVTLIIDGVSEVPAATRQALHEDLVAPVAAGQGARILLLGRDIAALREVFPASVSPTAYQMVELDADRRRDLANRMLTEPSSLSRTSRLQVADVRTTVAQVEHALGDAAGNPLLFTMGLTLVAEGIPFTSRATLYQAFVARLAERSGATGMDVAVVTLGMVYARLLDDGRRYADPYEWAQLGSDAAAELRTVGLSADWVTIDAAVRRCGLITPIGYTQTLAPIHDSFADYLSGAAHARRAAPYPQQLQLGDDQRVLFAAEIAGIDAALAALVARDLPFVTVRLADFDRRALTENAPAEVETLLCHLVPGHDSYPVALCRIADGRVLAVRNQQGQSEWVDQPTIQRLGETAPTVVIQDGGPLTVAVRLWRQDLLARLRTAPSLGASHPTSLGEACSALTTHASQVADAASALVQAVSPPGHTDVLAAAVGPLGLTATVSPATEGARGVDWPVSYYHTDNVRVTAQAGTSTARTGGHSTLGFLVTDAPAAAAAKRVRDSINRLTIPNWL